MPRIWIFAGVVVVVFAFGTGQPETTAYQYGKLAFFPEMPVAENNLVTIEGQQLGRFLFYDPILSRDSTISCASCHRQEVAFSDAPHSLSKGIDDQLTQRNTMPLFNLAWYQDIFWDGRAPSVEEQVFHPVRAHDEMDLDWVTATSRIRSSKFYGPLFNAAFGTIAIDSQLIAKAIAQFERTLISSNSKYDSVLRFQTYFTEDEYKGFELMNDQVKGGCLHCHITDGNSLTTNGSFANNGLDAVQKAEDFSDPGVGGITGKTIHMGAFKVPSLRNIAVTPPYMHDGRFKTLEEVLEFYSTGVQNSFSIDHKMEYAHQGGVRLTLKEQKQIIAFLHTLTDSAFLANPEFANPF